MRGETCLDAVAITEDDAAPIAASSTLAGTLPYMSPEQLTLGAVDHRADLWAVGIMLFEPGATGHVALAVDRVRCRGSRARAARPPPRISRARRGRRRGAG